jgi:hypothetical protein
VADGVAKTNAKILIIIGEQMPMASMTRFCQPSGKTGIPRTAYFISVINLYFEFNVRFQRPGG